MFEEFKKQAEKCLSEAWTFSDETKNIVFTIPSSDFGELSTSISFEIAKEKKENPYKLAENVVLNMNWSDYPLIESIKPLKGHINFYLNYDEIAVPLIKNIKEQGGNYGKGQKTGKRFVLEHTSANPDGPLHIGHGRNSIIGDSLVRLLRFAGNEVMSQYYLNDMGKQLAIVVWGLESMELDTAKKNDHAIVEIYTRANKMVEENDDYQNQVSTLMVSYESGDEAVVKRFQDAARYCMEGMGETLQRLNIHHDEITWESRFIRDGSVKEIVEKLKKSRFIRHDDVFSLDLEDFGIKKELVLMRSDGTNLYATRDIAHHLWKARLGGIIDVWGSDHKLMAQQMKAVLSILEAKEPEFIIYEFMTLPEGSMSTRRGKFISMDDLIEESVLRAYQEVSKRRPEEPEEFLREIAEKVGVGAIRYNIIRISPEKAMVFRWEDALDFDKQGAPFIQYAYARACRIMEKEPVPEDFQPGKLTENERMLLLLLSRFPEKVREAAASRKPSIISEYLQALATAFHRFYMFDSVLRSKESDFRLNLVYSTSIVLKNSMEILGITALEKM